MIFSQNIKPRTEKRVNVSISDLENLKSWPASPILIRCLDASSKKDAIRKENDAPINIWIDGLISAKNRRDPIIRKMIAMCPSAIRLRNTRAYGEP
jgi:hypothetical protein